MWEIDVVIYLFFLKFCATCTLILTFNVLVGSLHEDLGPLYRIDPNSMNFNQ